MTHIVVPSLALAMLASSASAAYSVRPVEQPWDNSLPAVNQSGDSFVLTREVKVEVDSPKTGRQGGYLFVAFDHSTGYFLPQFHVNSPFAIDPSITDTFRMWYRFAVDARGIQAFFSRLSGDGNLTTLSGTEKANNLDEAESKALKWAAKLEEDRQQGRSPSHSQWLLIYPLGKPADNPKDTIEFVPETLIGLAWSNGAWQMTFDGFVRRDKHRLTEVKHLRARLPVTRRPDLPAPNYVCVNDKSEEIACR